MESGISGACLGAAMVKNVFFPLFILFNFPSSAYFYVTLFT